LISGSLSRQRHPRFFGTSSKSETSAQAEPW
jgi:hypothetical protein